MSGVMGMTGIGTERNMKSYHDAQGLGNFKVRLFQLFPLAVSYQEPKVVAERTLDKSDATTAILSVYLRGFDFKQFDLKFEEEVLTTSKVREWRPLCPGYYPLENGEEALIGSSGRFLGLKSEEMTL